MPKYALRSDYEYCSGGEPCVGPCREEHGFPVGKWGIRVLDDGPWQKDDEGEGGNHFNWNKIPVPTDLCDLCADRVKRQREPLCVHQCLADCMKFGTVEEMAVEFAKKPKQVLWAPCDLEI